MLAIEAGNVKFIPHTCFSMPLCLAKMLLSCWKLSKYQMLFISQTCVPHATMCSKSYLHLKEKESVFCVLVLQSFQL